MGLFGINKCLKDWQVQAYIDNELDENTISKLTVHIEKCKNCQEKIEARKSRIDKVFSQVDILTDYDYSNKSNSISNHTNKHVSRYIIGVSVAASIVIAVLFFKHQTNITTSTPEKDCEWVALSSNEFQPDLESPNRLLRMRVVKCEELSSDSLKRVTYLVKTCKQ